MMMRSIVLLVAALFSPMAAAGSPAVWCQGHTYDGSFDLATDPLRLWLAQHAPMSEFSDQLQALGQRWLEVTSDPIYDAERVVQVADALATYVRIANPRQKLTAWEPSLTPANQVLVPLRLLGGANQSMTIACDSFSGDRTSQATLYFATAVRDISADGWGVDAERAAAEIQALYEGHRQRLANGLPMWPMETWINGLHVDPSGELPRKGGQTLPPPSVPTSQWIFLRPSASPALRFDGTEDSQLDVALTVEPIGKIWYTDRSFRRWIGASLMATLTNDNGVGYGGLLRYGPYTLGAAYHQKPKEALLYVSFDLYMLVLGKDQITSSGEAFLTALEDYAIERLKSTLTQGSADVPEGGSAR